MRTEDRDFRFSREVRLGELVAALSLISMGAAGYIELRLRPIDRDFVSIQRQISAIEAHSARLEAASLLTKREIREDLGRLESKLDRLLEREMKPIERLLERETRAAGR